MGFVVLVLKYNMFMSSLKISYIHRLHFYHIHSNFSLSSSQIHNPSCPTVCTLFVWKNSHTKTKFMLLVHSPLLGHTLEQPLTREYWLKKSDSPRQSPPTALSSSVWWEPCGTLRPACWNVDWLVLEQVFCGNLSCCEFPTTCGIKKTLFSPCPLWSLDLTML